MIKVFKKIVVLFFVLVFCFYTGLTTLIYAFTVYPFLERPYDADVWRSADPIERGYMLDSLLAREHQFSAFDKAMLTNHFGVPDADRGVVICYDIGPLEGRFGFMAFPYQLCMSINGNYFDRFWVTD